MGIANLAHEQDLGNTYVNCVYVRLLTDLMCQRANVYLMYVHTLLPDLEFGG